MVASTNSTSISYDKETVFGETDAAPAFTILPTTGGSPSNAITTAVSEVIREDRQTDDLVVVDGDISGDINYELSYLPFKDFLASVLMNNTTRATSLTLVGNNGTIDNTILDQAGIEAVVEPGDAIRLSSITDPTINGDYICVSNSIADEITIYPATGATAALTDLTVDTTEVRVNGADTFDSYTIRKIAKNGASSYYWYYTGCVINTMSFNFATGSILNGTVGIIGLAEEARSAPLVGEVADIPTPAYSIMNSVTSIGVIRVSGVTLGTCSFSSIDLTIDNQVNAAKGIGVLGACDLAAFSLQVTGNTEVYFSNLDLYNKFIAASSFSVTLLMTDGDGNTIGLDVPAAKFETLDTPISGKDAFLMQSGTIRGLRDQTNDYMIKVSRIDV